ncbi:MAG TPA: protoheme IX farnesyltransferase [Legionellales bacterium]|nr:protoheme IX farnesyltransferase [Legionellales bacterium]
MIQSNLFALTRVVKDYWELSKPRVVALMLVTVVVGMLLAPRTSWSWLVLIATLVGISLCAGSAAAINHLLDCHIDAKMQRTQNRPVVKGRVTPIQVLVFSFIMALVGEGILYYVVNPLTAGLTFLSLIGYAGIYTGFLKRATTQNIVIGGLAGAAPPLLGWTAITNHIDPEALLLVLIIFVWTPPHFWALALHRLNDYQKIEIPMFPVIYGEKLTKLHVLLYVFLLIIVTLLPVLIGMCGKIYFVGVTLLNLRFLYWAIVLYRQAQPQTAILTFKYSIYYLFGLFVLLLVDHYL